MTDDAFIAAIIADRDADVPRLVYADWLEERGDPRAEFLRVESQLLKLSPTDGSTQELRAKLEGLGQRLEPDWVALVRRVPVRDEIEAALSELEVLLPGLNYVVGLDIYRAPLTPDLAPERYISAALGPSAVVGGIHSVAGGHLLAEVEKCLRYTGDEGHGPDPTALRSREFNQRFRQVMGYLGRSVEEATDIAEFWLREGHPFPPVMWGFAYVLVKPQWAVVFTGSSSD